jgi:hypothetical protein
MCAASCAEKRRESDAHLNVRGKLRRKKAGKGRASECARQAAQKKGGKVTRI